MASALVATSAGSTSNTYITRADADSYFSDRLHQATWDAASDTEKDQVLLWAARLLDLQDWYGNRYTYTQALRWPRSNVPNLDNDDYLDESTIPNFLKYAQCELAFLLLGSDITLTPSTDGITAVKVGTLTLTLDDLRNRPDMLGRNVYLLIAGYSANAGPGGGGSKTVVRT